MDSMAPSYPRCKRHAQLLILKPLNTNLTHSSIRIYMGMLYKCSMKVISATKMRKWSQVRQRSAQMDYKKCEGQKNSVIQCCFAFFLLDFVFFWCFSCVYVHFEGKKQQPCNTYIITNNKFQKLKICIFLLHIPKNPFSPSKRAWKKRKKVLNPA